MNRIGFRTFLGSGLILLGALMLLQRLNILGGAVAVFWGVVFLAGGAFFLHRFALDRHGDWWALIPGFTLIGIAVSSFLPGPWSGFGFLGFLGLSFLGIYISDRRRWWALIPAGVLVTLGMISVLTEVYGARETGGFFFLGLGLTFLLVAVLGTMQWAYIPGIILILAGAAVGYTPAAGALVYIWPLALILMGLLLLLQFLRRK